MYCPVRCFGFNQRSCRKPKPKVKHKPNAAFMRPVQPDEKLSAIVGSKPLPRSELTKKLWDYIKKHGCQDKRNEPRLMPTMRFAPFSTAKVR